MINEKWNKEIFILKYAKSLATKFVVESEFFGNHWKDWLLGSFGTVYGNVYIKQSGST